MASAARLIASKALKLSPRERARLAQRLISSLDDQIDGDAEALWIAEAERRLDELQSGRVKGRSAASVLRRARAALR